MTSIATASRQVVQRRIARRWRGVVTPERRAAYAPSWFDMHARPNQKPPVGEWRIWLLLAGRGFGKSMTVNQWALHELMIERRPARTPTSYQG